MALGVAMGLEAVQVAHDEGERHPVPNRAIQFLSHPLAEGFVVERAGLRVTYSQAARFLIFVPQFTNSAFLMFRRLGEYPLCHVPLERTIDRAIAIWRFGRNRGHS